MQTNLHFQLKPPLALDIKLNLIKVKAVILKITTREGKDVSRKR
jgi:hypothetical protein